MGTAVANGHSGHKSDSSVAVLILRLIYRTEKEMRHDYKNGGYALGSGVVDPLPED